MAHFLNEILEKSAKYDILILYRKINKTIKNIESLNTQRN